MKVGDVMFFNRGSDLISSLISLFTKSQYTHVGIVYEVKEDSYILAEALANGFVLKEYGLKETENKFKTSKLVIKRAKGLDKKILKQAIENKIGRPYGFIQLLQIAIYKLTGKKLGKDDPERLICSEAVARVLFKSNPNLKFTKEFNKPFGYISPANLFHSKYLNWVEHL